MKTKLLIVGGGPIGLYLASKSQGYLLLEASDKLGGQISNLYPEKEITDLPQYPSLKAQEYVNLLIEKIDLDKVHFNEKVVNIIPGKTNKVISNMGSYEAENVVIATGLGFSSPRPLGIENENKCSNIFYHLNDFQFLKGKRIAIFGGGDSALDWAKELSAISDNVSLIHRRTEFRGNSETIKNCHNLHLFLPYIADSLKIKGGKCVEVTIKKVSDLEEEKITLKVDYILVNYGNVAEQTNLPFPKEGAFLVVNSNFEVAPHIFAIGDVAQYENKKRRIAPGNLEADKVLKIIG